MLLQHHSSEATVLRNPAFFMVELSHSYLTTGKKHSFVKLRIYSWYLKPKHCVIQNIFLLFFQYLLSHCFLLFSSQSYTKLLYWKNLSSALPCDITISSSLFHHQNFAKHSVNSKHMSNELIFIFLSTNTRNLPNNSIEYCSQGIHFLFLFSLSHIKLTSQTLRFPQHLCNLSCHLVTFHYFLFYKQLLIILPNQIMN